MENILEIESYLRHVSYFCLISLKKEYNFLNGTKTIDEGMNRKPNSCCRTVKKNLIKWHIY